MGLGLAIIMLQFLVPRVFTGAENTLLAFFESLQSILSMSGEGMLPASVLPGVEGL